MDRAEIVVWTIIVLTCILGCVYHEGSFASPSRPAAGKSLFGAEIARLGMSPGEEPGQERASRQLLCVTRGRWPAAVR